MIPILEGCTLVPGTGRIWEVFTTPFLDPSNDRIQICVKEENGTYTLTDDGDVCVYLFLHGIDLDDPKNERIVKQITIIANWTGVVFDHSELRCSTNLAGFLRAYCDMIGAILQIEATVWWR